MSNDPNAVDDTYDDVEDDANAADSDDQTSNGAGEDDGEDRDANTAIAGNARAVLSYLVRSVVDDPDAVNIEIDDDGRRPALNVTVGDGDMGRVIGKRGRVAQSIRTVTRAAAVNDDIEIDIEFLD